MPSCSGCALRRERDREPGCAQLVEQPAEVGERRLRSLGLRMPQLAEQQANVGERLARRGRDGAERAIHRIRVVLLGVAGAVRLRDHDGERVRDHVVHVARDAVALLLDDDVLFGGLGLELRRLLGDPTGARGEPSADEGSGRPRQTRAGRPADRG